MPAEHHAAAQGPLAGLRVLDISTIIAAPFAATLLADFGADVIKTELPGKGDALRALAPHKENVSLWWKVTNRNKRGITLDLRRDEGRALLARLIPSQDVLVENFRPGTLDRWGITREWLHDLNPRLTILRMTGFGQTGPHRNRPGFARIFEAMSGFTHLCGEENGPPLHLGYPISDAVGGMFGALGVLAALYDLQINPARRGQEIDCSVTESMLRVLDFLAIEYDQLGTVRGRSGNHSQYAAPGDLYVTRDGKWASLAISAQSIYERFCAALGLDTLLTDPRFADNPSRLRHSNALDAIVSDAIRQLSMGELRERLDRHEVGFSPIYDISEVFTDPQLTAREAIVRVHDSELGNVRMQGVVPRFSATPGAVHHAGPALGEHNAEVYGELGLAVPELERLRAAGVI